jgi:hypothetical protein
MKDHNVTWPCVIDTQGWSGINQKFNVDGYGLTLIGADGIVQGIDLRPEEIERKLPSLVAMQGHRH